jgi:hypothetical protein
VRVELPESIASGNDGSVVAASTVPKKGVNNRTIKDVNDATGMVDSVSGIKRSIADKENNSNILNINETTGINNMSGVDSSVVLKKKRVNRFIGVFGGADSVKGNVYMCLYMCIHIDVHICVFIEED